MKKFWIYFLLVVIGINISCSNEEDMLNENELVSLTDFDDGSMDNWMVDFAQYPVGLEDSFGLSHRIGDIYTPNFGSKCLILSGKSLNRDLFMFVKGEIGGFDPDTFYDVIIDVEICSILLES